MDDRYYSSQGSGSYMHGGPVNNMHQQRTSAHPSGGGNPYGYANYGSKSYMQQPMQRMSMTMSTNEMGGRPMSSVNMTQGRPMMTSSMGSQRGSMTSSQATRGHPSNMPRYGPGPSMMGNMYNSQGGSHMNNGYPMRHHSETSQQSSFESEFPALGGNTQKNTEQKQVRRDYQEDFPALGGSSQSYSKPVEKETPVSSYQDSSRQQHNYDQSSGNTPQPTKSQDNKYGLLGLLSLIHTTEPENLALGIDLTTLGLNLNTPSTLYNSFTSPFMDAKANGGLDAASMRSYKQPKMQPAQEKVKSFEDSTLFFMFYGMPQDRMQLVASAELFNRGWRYHKKDQHWYRPVSNTNDLESGASFHCFEPATWKSVVKNNFVFHVQDFESNPPSIQY